MSAPPAAPPAGPAPSGAGRAPLALGLAAVAAVAVLAHWPALGGGWVLDDALLIRDNPYLRGAAGLPGLLTLPFFVASASLRFVPYYRPLSGLLNWVSWQVAGDSTGLQHLFNLALHATCAVLLVRAAVAVGVARGAALAGGFLLAAHPAGSDVVAYLGGRQDLLGWILVWLGVAAVARAPTAARVGVVVGLTTLGAALTREFFLATPALVLPAVLVSGLPRRAGLGAAVGGGTLAVAAVFGLRALADVPAFESHVQSTASPPAAAAEVALRLLRVLFWPTDLSVDVTLAGLGTGAGIAVLLGLGGVAGLLLWLARRAGALVATALGVACFGALVLLHTGVALKYDFISDRYGYGALAALGWVAPSLGSAALARWAPGLAGRAALLRGLGGALLVPLALLSWARDAEYRSEDSLLEAMIRARPDDPRTLYAQANTLWRQGRFEEAYPLCVRYRERYPTSVGTNLCVGTGLLERRQPRLAAEVLWPHVLATPGDPVGRHTLLRALFASGDLEGVQQVLDRYRASFAGSPELLAAERELARRRQPPEEPSRPSAASAQPPRAAPGASSAQ